MLAKDVDLLLETEAIHLTRALRLCFLVDLNLLRGYYLLMELEQLVVYLE
jgi:hypothetical protein